MIYTTKTAEETIELGKRFATLLARRKVFALHGELGSGKTTFTQGIAQGFGITRPMTSPTFIIMRTYDIPSEKGKQLYHVDLYRTETLHDIEGLGLVELLSEPDNLFVIEWPEKMKSVLPDDIVHIYFSYGEDETHTIEVRDRDMVIDETWYQKPDDTFPVRISAGGAVVREENGKLLVALVHEGAFDKLVLPKGGVDAGESLEEAAKREISEEAGITELTLLGPLGIYERLTFHKQAWTKQHLYLFITNQVDTHPTETDHVYTTEWFPLDALPEMYWKEQKEALEKNQDLIERLVTSYHE